jgi:hypothetical protein
MASLSAASARLSRRPCWPNWSFSVMPRTLAAGPKLSGLSCRIPVSDATPSVLENAYPRHQPRTRDGW